MSSDVTAASVGRGGPGSRLAVPVLVLLLGGWCAHGLAPAGVGQDRRDLAPLAGRGLLLPVLGGYRAIVADVLWLRAYGAWSRREAAATEVWVRAAIAADERSRHYRVNGARMLAFDLAGWEEEPGLPRAVREARRRGYAERGLGLLEAGVTGAGAESDYLIEMARISHQQLGDLDRAARYYRRAAETPGAPFFAGRLHAEMLVRAGRLREACDWLRAWLPTLPAGEPAAARDLVAARLAELERRLASEAAGGS